MTSKMLMAGVMATAAASVASAGLITGSPIETWTASTYGVEFVSSSAGATGSLYFLGWQGPGEAITYTPSTDSNEIGKFLFSNKKTQAGATVEIGAFEAGTTLHFAYLITKGVKEAPMGQIQRTDSDDTSAFFGYTLGTDAQGYFAKIGVEDVLDPKVSDMDYNDIMYKVRSIPAPGGAALMAVSLLIVGPRSRRRAN